MTNSKLMTMKQGWRAISLAALMVVGHAALAQTAERFDLNLKDADLVQATQMLTRQTGIQFIIAPSDKEFNRVTLSLAHVTPEEAIRYLCQAAGAWAEKDENGVYVIHRGTPNVTHGNDGVVQPKVKAPSVVRKIKIIKADARAVLEMIRDLKPVDAALAYQELQQVAARSILNQPIPAPSLNVISNGFPAQGYPMNTKEPQVSSSTSGFGGNDIVLPGETARQAGFGTPGGGSRGGGQGGGPSGGQGNAGGGGTQLTPGQGYVPEGIEQDKITYDPTDNSLVVQGSEEAIRQLQRIIALFDVAPKQVVIKIEFITTTQGASKSLGIDWLYQRGAVAAGNRPGSFARVGDPIFINYATGNVTTRLRTLLLESQGKSVQAPLLRTLNNQPATVALQTTTTIFITQVVNGAGGITQFPTPVQIPINTSIAVRPRINDDGYVTMTLTPVLSDIGQLRRGPDGQEIPDISTQAINVVARVKSGNTIALAGFTRKSTNSSVSRFPILSDLPIIGQFFKQTTSNRSDSELIVFVTPYIVEDDDAGGLTP